MKLTRGFSLVEILVAVSVLGIFSVAVSQVFFTILRTQSRTEIIQDVKQSGDYAFSVMETAIRNAKVVSFPPCDDSDSASNIHITNPDDSETIFSCDASGKITVDDVVSAQLRDLTDSNVTVSDCSFILACPVSSSGVVSKYVYFTYTVAPVSVPTNNPLLYTSEVYQGTVTLRNEAGE